MAQAAAIVRDATQVDWSREPQTEYERAIRAAFIAQRLGCNVPFGVDRAADDRAEFADRE